MWNKSKHVKYDTTVEARTTNLKALTYNRSLALHFSGLKEIIQKKKRKSISNISKYVATKTKLK